MCRCWFRCTSQCRVRHRIDGQSRARTAAAHYCVSSQRSMDQSPTLQGRQRRPQHVHESAAPAHVACGQPPPQPARRAVQVQTD